MKILVNTSRNEGDILQHFWVVGTDTDVGKTFITTILMRYLQKQGLKVTPYKPVQTGEIERNGHRYYHDTSSFLDYSLHPLAIQSINTYSFPVPASPHYAAELAGERIKEDKILNEIHQLQKEYDTVICEGAGGLYVPLHSDTSVTLLDVIQKSKLPVILVAHSKLGTINHTMLSVNALKEREIDLLGIVFNQFGRSALEEDNIATLERFIPDIPFAVAEVNRTIESFDDESIFERLMTRDIQRTSRT